MIENTYSDVLSGQGKFPGESYKLQLKPNSTPAKHRPRKLLVSTFNQDVEKLVNICIGVNQNPEIGEELCL